MSALVTYITSKGSPSQVAINDGRNVVYYAGLPALMNDIAGFFRQHPKESFHCLYVPVQNNLASALLILYLLDNNINFFLYTPNALSAAGVPRFCDRILTMKAGHTAIPGFDIGSNPDFCAGNDVLTPASGAVVFSSSGTTGIPKYIYFPSGKLLLNAKKCAARFRLDASRTVLVPVPINHMYGLGAGWLPAVLSGCSICLIEKNNIIKLADCLRQYTPDVTLVTPAVCKMMLLLGSNMPFKGTFITAGERIKAATHREFERLFGPLINLYGCTELGAVATSSAAADTEKRIEAGLIPLQGVQIRIDGKTQGEIWCRHPARFSHYMDSLGNKLPSEPENAGWHRTHDLGSKKQGNRFEVTGRIDNCVNRSGFLVSLEEIEAVLENLVPGINQVIVIRGESENLQGVQLVAICETRQPGLFSGEALRSAGRAKLQNHQLPDAFYCITEMPRLANGKPDRNWLRNNYSFIINNV